MFECFHSIHLCRGVVIAGGEGQKGLKPPFKYYRNGVFSLMLSNEKFHFETNSELTIPSVNSIV